MSLIIVIAYGVVGWWVLFHHNLGVEDEVAIGRALFWPLMVVKFLIAAVVWLVKLLYLTIKREFSTLNF